MALTSRKEATAARLSNADFSGEPTSNLPNTPGQAWIEERTRIAVGRGINVSGRLVFQEPVRIEGRFKGEISSGDLVVISDHASVEGRVRTPRVLVLGELNGDIVSAKSVVLGPRSRMKGNIDSETVTICEGAHYEGDVRAKGAPDPPAEA